MNILKTSLTGRSSVHTGRYSAKKCNKVQKLLNRAINAFLPILPCKFATKQSEFISSWACAILAVEISYFGALFCLLEYLSEKNIHFTDEINRKICKLAVVNNRPFVCKIALN